MEDNLNIGGNSEVRSNSTLADTFKKWIKIDYWASLILLILMSIFYGDALSRETESTGNGVIVMLILASLSIVFANVKKYFLLVILSIYENTHTIEKK